MSRPGHVLASLLLPAALLAQRPAAPIPVIPMPAEVVAGAGSWSPRVPLPADLLAATEAQLGAAGIRVRQVSETTVVHPEGYRLAISPTGIILRHSGPAGRFYGLQTLQQLVDAAPRREGRPVLDAMSIADAPRFGWRGLHLDVGRHFQPVSFIKRTLDLMARYKLNTFHWHLTEDQGWRIQILKYPRLTEVGSCRRETILEKHFDPYVGDGTPHCGFYTQDEIREVVAYAAARQITVVPEIEMPGHSVAALAAYPELACTPGPFEVMTIWGVSDDIYCPSEQTFTFLQDVLTEVLALFPSPFIHIGGDEAPKVRWQASPLAQEIIRREGLKDEHELQSWFIRRIDRWLTAHDRRLIGWDEILEGGLAPGAAVMSWRGVSGGIAAAMAGHDVVMTPTSHLYLDYYQGDARFEPLAIGGLVTLNQVYGYEPVPDTLTPAQATHILGAQGNLWTEYLSTPAQIEYMMFPRALALAELTWSPKAARSWPSFEARLPSALRTLDRLGVHYRLPHVVGLEADALTLDDHVTVPLSVALDGATIRYTLDGTDPTAASTVYTGPLTLPVTPQGVTVTARAFTAQGAASPPRAATFRRTAYREAVAVAAVEPGLQLRYIEAALRTVTPLDTLPALRTEVAASIGRPSTVRPEGYGLTFDGFLTVPADTLYEFELTSDDGSTLQIGDAVIVDHDGPHGPEARTGMIALRSGAHPFRLRYFQAGGGAELRLRVRPVGGTWQPVPADWLFHRP